MKDYTEIICILDRSGSMSSVIEDAIGGFNQFLQDQKQAPGSAAMTIVQFNHRYDLVVSGVDIQEVEPLDRSTYAPTGFTSLLDAIGRTIDDVGLRLAGLSESDRPVKVIVAILTDGRENTSRDYTHERVAQMIDLQRNVYSWEFVFLSSDQQSVRDAVSLGIDPGNVMSFANSGEGHRAAYRGLSSSVMSYRVGGGSSLI